MKKIWVLVSAILIFFYSFLLIGCNPALHFEISDQSSIDSLNSTLSGELFRVTTKDTSYEGSRLTISYDSTRIKISSLIGNDFSLLAFPTRDIVKIQIRKYLSAGIKGIFLGAVAGVSLGGLTYVCFVGPDPGKTNSGEHPEFRQWRYGLMLGGAISGAAAGFLLGYLNGEWRDINITFNRSY